MLERIISSSRRGIVNAALGLSLALGGAYAAGGCEGDTTVNNYGSGADTSYSSRPGSSTEGFCHKLWEMCPGIEEEYEVFYDAFMTEENPIETESTLETCLKVCDENASPLEQHHGCVSTACIVKVGCCEGGDGCGETFEERRASSIQFGNCKESYGYPSYWDS